jgi:RNA recognition motif-containing protein
LSAFAIEHFVWLIFDNVTSINTQKKGRRYMNIYVGNMPYSVTESDLKETFSEFGEHGTGRSDRGSERKRL